MLVPNIYPVTCHTDHVGPGSTFVAIKGFTHDGTQFIGNALAKGATTIIVEHASHAPELEQLCAQHNAMYLTVPDARKALAEHAAQRLGNPASKLHIIGITGTKGKTTTTYLTEYLLRHAGYKTALSSSIVQKIGDQHDASKHATPESDYLQMFLYECVKRGVQYVAMEISSHALSLHRVHGIQFAAVGFSNLSNDHLDFYGDMENYFQAKLQLFSQVKPGGLIVVNTDTDWGVRALEHAQQYDAEVIGYGHDDPSIRFAMQNTPSFAKASEGRQGERGRKNPFVVSDREAIVSNHIPLSIIQTNFSGIHLNLGNQTIGCPSLFGPFNGYNIAMATLLCKNATINAQAALASFPGVPGRLQFHRLKTGAYAFVDYAHNTHSFQEVLSMLRSYTNHLIIVFGGGGDKPKERRFGMGSVAAQFADVIVLTDDNPRFEDRHAIINDILSAIPEEKGGIVHCQPDRRKAIEQAVALSKEGSIVALLGKGHETYYSIQGQTHHFDDFEEISKF